MSLSHSCNGATAEVIQIIIIFDILKFFLYILVFEPLRHREVMGKKNRSKKDGGEAPPTHEGGMSESIKSVDLEVVEALGGGPTPISEPFASVEEDLTTIAGVTSENSGGKTATPSSTGWATRLSKGFTSFFQRAKQKTTEMLPGVTGRDVDVVVTEEATKICSSGALDGQGPSLDPRVIDLVWGWSADMAVDRQNIGFYRLNVSSKNVEDGFVIQAISASRGNFKIFMFDDKGNTILAEDCVRSFDGTQTTAMVFFTKFDTYSLKKTPVSAEANSAVIGVTVVTNELSPSLFTPSTPSLFSKLDNLQSIKSTLIPIGQYLLCVCGNNMLPGKTDVRMLAVPALADGPDLLKMQNADISLVHLKDSLHQLKSEYLTAKETFENCIARMNEQERALYMKLQSRDDAYKGYIGASASAFAPEAYSVPQQVVPSSSDDDQVSGNSEVPSRTSGEKGTFKPTNSADSREKKTASPQQVGIILAGTPVEVVTSTAAQAGGWIANKVTLGIGSLQQMVKNAATPPPPLTSFSVTPPGNGVGADDSVSLAETCSEDALAADPELEPVFEELQNAKKRFDKKNKAYKKMVANYTELLNRRAAQVESDKARFVKEAELSTESWLESFGLDDEQKVKQEVQAREFAESMLKQRIAAFEQKAKDETAAIAADQSEKEKQAAAELEYTRVAYSEMLKTKDNEVARVTAIREEHKKQRECDEAKALVERLTKEAENVSIQAKNEDEENVRKQELAKEWAEKLEQQRVAIALAAAAESEEKRKQMEEATSKAEKLAEERRVAEQKKLAILLEKDSEKAGVIVNPAIEEEREA